MAEACRGLSSPRCYISRSSSARDSCLARSVCCGSSRAWGPCRTTLCEAPFLLAAIVFAARFAPRVTGLNKSPVPMAFVGLIALVLQQAADLAVGVLLRGISVPEILAHFATPEGAIYAILLALFAAMPWLLRGFPA